MAGDDSHSPGATPRVCTYKAGHIYYMSIEDIYRVFLRHPVVTTDSRHCPAGSLFVALRGTSFNGNAFAADALRQGCAYAVVDETASVPEGDSRYLVVADGLATLQDLARHHRQTLATPVIAVTGTNGKTTTKELIAAVLSKRHNVLYTLGNLNNHIGVPMTLLRLTPEHDIAVIEMGANHPGEIRTLVNIADPDMGIITNVGRAHLEGFGSLEGVKRTKGELYDYLAAKSDDSIIFINADDADLWHMADDRGINHRLCYGTRAADALSVRGEVTGCDPFLSFRWHAADGTAGVVSSHLIGSYNLPNMLAAVTVGLRFGVTADDITAALTDYVPSNNRSQLTITAYNRLIVDAYNANPTSMAAAINNFSTLQADNKMLILGDMGELGDDSAEEHLEVMRLLDKIAIPEVWLVGKAFRAAGRTLPVDGTRYFDSVDDVEAAIAADRPQGHTILIKGSNATQLFRLPPLL